MELNVNDLPISKSILENVSQREHSRKNDKQQNDLTIKQQESPQIQSQNEFLIQFQIQEQMKKYQKTKVQAQHLEQQDKNNIKLQVWQQLFGKAQTASSELKPRLQSCQANPTQQQSYKEQSLVVSDQRKNEQSPLNSRNSLFINNTRFNSQNIQKSSASETQKNQNFQIDPKSDNISQQRQPNDIPPKDSQINEVQKQLGLKNKFNLQDSKSVTNNSSKYSEEEKYSNKHSQKYIQEVEKSDQEPFLEKSSYSEYQNPSKINDFKLRISSQQNNDQIDPNIQKSFKQEDWRNQVSQKLQQIENWNNSALQKTQIKNDSNQITSQLEDWNLSQKDQQLKNQSYKLSNYSQNYFKPQTENSRSQISQENLSLTPGQQSFQNNNSQSERVQNQSSYQNSSQNKNQQFAQTSKFNTVYLGNLKNLDYKIQYLEYNDNNQEDEDFEYQEENLESIDVDLNNRSIQKIFDQVENLKQQSQLQHIDEEEESHFEQKSLNFPQNQSTYRNNNSSEFRKNVKEYQQKNDSQYDNSQSVQESYQMQQSQMSNEFLVQEKSEEKIKQQFIQYDIELEDDDVEQRRSKFEALKRRKLEEIERAKQERQKKRIWDDQNEFPTPTMSNTPKRDRSPMMPSAYMRSKSKIDDEDIDRSYQRNKGVNKSQERKFDNIFKDDQQQYLPPKASNKQKTIQKEDQLEKINKNHRPPSDRPRMVSATRANPKIEVAQTPNTLRSKRNNKQILKNAIINVCLAGEPNKKDREYVLAEMERCESEHFIMLLKGAFGRMDFRALYGMSQQDETPHLIFSLHKSPISLDPFEVTQYFKYDSGSKEFKSIPVVKSFSFAIDAVKIKR